MKHSVNEIWQFLRDNDVKKVRINGDHFEFLTVTGERISPGIFIRGLLSKIRGRPKHSIIRKVSVQHRDGYGLRRHALGQPQKEKQGHPEVEALKVWNRDIRELHNKVLYNEVKISQDLAIRSDEELEIHKGRKGVIITPNIYVKKYVEALKKFHITNPTNDALWDATGISSSTWSRQLNNSEFLSLLEEELKKMQGYRYSKNEKTKRFWRRAEAFIAQGRDRIKYNEDAMEKDRIVPLDRDPADYPAYQSLERYDDLLGSEDDEAMD